MFIAGRILFKLSSLLGIILALATSVQPAEDTPYALRYTKRHKNFRHNTEDADSAVMFEILARLGQTIVRSNDVENYKRGLDLGLSRGWSGSQQARHMMGLAAAGMSVGPGRRRRNHELERSRF